MLITTMTLSGDQKHQIQPWFYQIGNVKYDLDAIRKSEKLITTMALSDGKS